MVSVNTYAHPLMGRYNGTLVGTMVNDLSCTVEYPPYSLALMMKSM